MEKEKREEREKRFKGETAATNVEDTDKIKSRQDRFNNDFSGKRVKSSD